MNSTFLSRLLCLLPFLLTLSTDFAFAETREEALKRLNKKIATVTAVSAVQKSLADVTALADVFEEHLAAEIMAAPKEHRKIERSRQLGRTASIESFINGRINNAISEVLRTQPNVTHAELTAALPPGIRTKAVADVAGSLFNKVFENARRQAVGQQFEKLRNQIKPPGFDDINRRLNQNASWDAHVADIQSALKRSTSVAPELMFEENETAIDRLIRECLDKVDAELDTQNRLVRAIAAIDLPENALFEDEILAAASADLESSLKRQNASYSLFDTVRKQLGQRARELETDRYARFVKSAAIEFPTAAALRACITENPAEHHKPKASLERLIDQFRKSTTTAFAEHYVRQVQNPPASVESRLIDLSSRAPIQQAIAERLQTQLARSSETVREAICEEQIQQFFGNLASLKPTEQQIEAQYDSRKSLDYAEAVGIIGGTPPEPDTLLAETVAQVIRGTNEAVQSRVSKLQSQLSVLRTMETELADDLLLDVAAEIPKESVTDKWEKILVSKFTGDTLFARTQRELNKTVSQHYTATRQKLEERQATRSRTVSTAKTEMQKQEQQSTADQSRASNSNAASDSNTGSGVAGGAGSEGDGTMEATEEGGNPDFAGGGPPPHGTITFRSGTSGQVLAISDFSELGVSFDPVAVEASAQKLTDAFAEPLMALRVKRPPEKPGDSLRIAIVIGTDDIRHRMSILFRTASSQRLGSPVLWADAAGR